MWANQVWEFNHTGQEKMQGVSTILGRLPESKHVYDV